MVLLLPLHEMRQHLLGGLAVADEVVVDEIKRGRRVRLREDIVELADDLLRRLHARLAAVEAGDVAELAGVGTARRELQRAQQVSSERDRAVGRHREFGQRQALLGVEANLFARAAHVIVEQADQRVGGVTHFAAVEIVDVRIHFGRSRDRGPAEHHHLAGRVRAPRDVVDLFGLDVHAADQHDVGPREVGSGRRRDVLVHEPHRPAVRHVGGDQQQPLRRHERLHAVHQLVGVLERAEGGRVGRKHAQHPTFILHRDRTTHCKFPVLCLRRRAAWRAAQS